jgi:predicted acetyltransferase
LAEQKRTGREALFEARPVEAFVHEAIALMPLPPGDGPQHPGLNPAPARGDQAFLRFNSRPRAEANGAEEASCLRELSAGARIVTAHAGDHASVLQLLVQSRQAALADDFQSRCDAPGYQPSNRLILRRGHELWGHVHVASHIGWFERQRVPLVRLEDFEVLPEYRGAGYDAELLGTAESIAAREGAVLAVISTDRVDWFRQQGWSVLRGQGHTRAGASAVLAHLDAQEQLRGHSRSSIQVRTWRHFELDQIRRVYDESACKLWGPLFRSEESWQWLIGRKLQDQVLVAVQRSKGASLNGNGKSSHNLNSNDPAEEEIVGYAVVRGSCIVELMTLKKFATARLKLLARACREAMDRDHRWVSLYAPASDSLHELLVTAGGAWVDQNRTPGPRLMIRLLSPEKWVERCYPLWRRRARKAEVARPFEFTIQSGGSACRYTLTRRSSRLEHAPPGLADIECDRTTFESLLLGNLAISSAARGGTLRLARPELAGPLGALFSPRLFWQSALELMRL